MPQALNIGALLGSLAGVAPAGGAVGSTEGLAGLFNTLVGQAEGVGALSGLPADAEAQLAALLNSLPVAQGVTAQPAQNVLLGETPVQVTGEAQAVQVLTQTISVLYQQITIQGGFSFGAQHTKGGATGDLAAALTKLGLPADEAQALAARIDTMLEILRLQLEGQQQALDDQTGGSLVVVLLASLLSPQQAQALQIPSSTATLTQVQVSVSQVQVRGAAFTAASGSALEGLLHKPAYMQAPAQPIFIKATPQPQVEVALTALAETATPQIQISLSAEAKPVTPTAGAFVAPLVQPIEQPQPLQGTTLYKLTEGENGTPVLQALAVKQPEAVAAPATDVAPALPDTAALNLSVLEVGKPLTVTTTLAEKVQQAYQHQVAEQVKVAIQPLLKGQGDHTGGAVRMTLNPPELGRIEVHLKIENGQVSGTIAAQETAVVEHLARELPTLRQSFADAGLKIAEQGLSLMLSNQQQDNPQAQNPFATPEQPQGRGGKTIDGEGGLNGFTDSVTTNPTNRWVSPEALVDVAA
jgi:flagellar hook-length control protein FliK